MSIEPRDPLYHSLDALASTADTDVVGDRVDSVTRRFKARRTRRRAAIAGGAALAVLAIGSVASLPSGSSDIAPASGDPSGTERPDDRTPGTSTGGRSRLTLDFSPLQNGAETVGFEILTVGRSREWAPTAEGTSRAAGVSHLEVLLDGQPVKTFDYGPVECQAGTRLRRVDDLEPVTIAVPGPSGPHEVVVRGAFCGDDGNLVQLEESRSVDVFEVDPEKVGFTAQLLAEQAGPRSIAASIRIHGWSHAWTSVTGETLDHSGPNSVRILVDGKEVVGAPPMLGCEPSAPRLPYDSRWNGRWMEHLPVAGPGTYEITLETSYCDADGTEVPVETSRTVTVR